VAQKEIFTLILPCLFDQLQSSSIQST